MASAPSSPTSHSVTDLTSVLFGEALSLEEAAERIGLAVTHVTDPDQETTDGSKRVWLGSVGYERHRDSEQFARHLRQAGVERLIDVRELPISRRRGYAKTALAAALQSVGIEYMHIKALGNPKPYRDLYKSGRISEGRDAYRKLLVGERLDTLRELVPLLEGKRSALMCVEHDKEVCHRLVIMQALQTEMGIGLDVAEVG